MATLIINKTKSKISIRDFYRIGDGGGGESTGYYGSFVYKLKPNGYWEIDPSYFERLSKSMFAPLEIRLCRRGESEIIAYSPLELEFCDGIVISIDDNDKLHSKFVKTGKVSTHQWLKYCIPILGIKKRIEHILSVSSTETTAKPVPG